MANRDELIMRAWDEWENITGAEANNPDDFVAWALDTKKLVPHMQDIRKLLRKQVTSVLRQAMRRDAAGFSYRAKQCVLIADEDAQYRLWFDTDKGGTPNLRQKATRQRREAIASDVYRAVCDVEHMRTAFPGEQLNFFPDFTDDVAEHRVADLLADEKTDEEDEAA